MEKINKSFFTLAIILLLLGSNVSIVSSQQLFKLAKENKDAVVFSTLFIAGDVRDYLSTPAGLDNAVKWCMETGLTRVFIETFRGGYYADRETIIRARDRFRKEGIDVAGCVTTVNVGKNGAGGWGATACYTNKATLDELEKIFELSAALFDTVMIDDFLFTECECEDCMNARGDQTWAKFRSDMMVNVSFEHILKPAKKINPNVKIIIKYPLWYDSFQDRGYEVVRETKDYDLIWVGTETRDYDYKVRPGGEVQYNAFFIMRWLSGIGGGKTGGGWIDALGTTQKTYLEQARQTILGNGKEVMLFHYGDLIRDSNFYDKKPGTPKANILALRKEMPGLFELAKIIKDKPLKGIHMPKIPNSEPFNEKYIFSFFGMLGLPLVPGNSIDTQAKSAIFTVHALKEPGFSGKLDETLKAGHQVLITDQLAKLISNQVLLEDKNLTILKVGGDPKNLLDLKRQDLKVIRDKLMAPFGLKFDAPNKVSLYLLGENLAIIENFNNENANVSLDFPADHSFKAVLTLPASSSTAVPAKGKLLKLNIPGRTLIAVEY